MGRRFGVKILKVISIFLAGLAFAVLFALIFGFAVQLLWNHLMPELFAVRTITYWQAFGLVILAKILFGAWGSFSGGRHWRKHRPSCGRPHPDWDEGWDSDIPYKRWKHYKNFWREEGKKAFEDYVTRVERAAKKPEE